MIKLQSYILSTTTETQPSCVSHWCPGRFNRTSFQQQLKRLPPGGASRPLTGFNRTSFQQQLKLNHISVKGNALRLQSYILSTTTETTSLWLSCPAVAASIVHPFNNNWNSSAAELVGVQISLQSYILSTTTETTQGAWNDVDWVASIVHPFNNNWN